MYYDKKSLTRQASWALAIGLGLWLLGFSGYIGAQHRVDIVQSLGVGTMIAGVIIGVVAIFKKKPKNEDSV